MGGSEPVRNDASILICRHVWKIFQRGRRVVRALMDVSLEVNRQEIVCVIGPSGSGKSTLLNLLGTLDLETKGDVYGLGVRYADLSNEECNRFRRHNIGFVFQELRLISHLTAAENVMLQKLFDGMNKSNLEAIALRLLERMEMSERADHFPYELSYGEQQRVAIARAIVTQPKIIFADEPTANLDEGNADGIIRVFQDLKAAGATIVAATHDGRLARTADRLIRLERGVLKTNALGSVQAGGI